MSYLKGNANDGLCADAKLVKFVIITSFWSVHAGYFTT